MRTAVEPNKPLEQTAHPIGFLDRHLLGRGWAAAHRQRSAAIPSRREDRLAGLHSILEQYGNPYKEISYGSHSL
jgi:hypothetical protein